MVVELLDRGAREHYDDAALYDYEYRRRLADVRFYRELAKELLGGPGEILELACGTGRLTTRLARDGHQVIAVDLHPGMLARAQARRQALGVATRNRIELICADMRRFALARRFPLVIMAFNSFEHLYTRVEVAACLASIRQHLADGGTFVFDVQNPNPRWLDRDPNKRWAKTKFRLPETGERMVYTTNHDYDPISQIALIRLFYRPESGGPEKVVHLSQRKFFPAELEALISYNGFRVERRFGDFDGGELTGEAMSQVLVCRPR